MAWLRKEQSASSGYDDEGSRFTQPGFIASALVILFVVLSAVYLAVAGNDGKTRSAPPSAAPNVAPVTLAPIPDSVSADANECPFTPVTDVTRPTQPPRDVAWQSFRTVLLPASSTAGPMVTQGDVARCYQQTPTGALLATAQITTRYALAENWLRVVAEQVLPGPSADAYSLPRIERELTRGAPRPPEPGSMSQIAGFKFVTYSFQSASLEIARRTPDGKLQAFVHTVVWTHGDWKLELQPDGADAPIGRNLISLEGFIPWGGS
ncbi:hypothetical protein [Embleya scabrispora]|uniref:hypothetical protein n=1 Tax=Embleya scabrispora TaxID=159449 RepID=UPI00036D6F85|nr:hypothetical protein [Embleya scabrispora]MYS87369.1 hypothetical protein [Streptomyces sp. SID5474]